MNDAQIRELITEALKNHTSAKNRVYSPRDWPTKPDLFPAILVSAPFETKRSHGRHAPQFTTVTTVRVVGRVICYDSEDEDNGAELAAADCEILKGEIERAVINNPDIQCEIQQFVKVESETIVSAEGEGHIGQLVIHFEVEYYQGPEDFFPIEAPLLDEVHVREPMVEGAPAVELNIDLTKETK